MNTKIKMLFWLIAILLTRVYVDFTMYEFLETNIDLEAFWKKALLCMQLLYFGRENIGKSRKCLVIRICISVLALMPLESCS